MLAGELIKPNSQVLLKSLKTNKYCRVVLVNGLEQIKCDVDTAAQATPLDYTGTGFSYKVGSVFILIVCHGCHGANLVLMHVSVMGGFAQGRPFTNPGAGEPLYLGGPGTPTIISPSGWLPCSTLP